MDRDGEVDTAEDASSDGSYRGVDPFGLFWSAEVSDAYDWDVLHPMRVTLRATCDEQSVATTYARPVLAESVTEHVVAEPGVVGRLFLPAGDGRRRGVVILGGSVGGPGGPVDGRAAGRPRRTGAVGSPTGDIPACRTRSATSTSRWRSGRATGCGRRTPSTTCRRAWSAGRGAVSWPCWPGSLLPDRVGPLVSVVGSGVPWGALGTGYRRARDRAGGSTASRCRRWPRTRTTPTPASTTRRWSPRRRSRSSARRARCCCSAGRRTTCGPAPG